MWNRIAAACGAMLALTAAVQAADKVGPWDPAAMAQPPKTYEAPGFSEAGVRALFYEGMPWKGKPTRVFAWYGAPEVKPGQKVPAMVLIHGGGGTAFAEWVRLWNERGYAAIAMDTCGATAGGQHSARPRHAFGGPPGWGGFDQIDEAPEDQWMYHAVADVILAHSLIRSFPEVDPNRIGVTGISWGGIVTGIVAGVDDRFRFAVPVYGTGFLGYDSAMKAGLDKAPPEKAQRWLTLWDPSSYLGRVKMPMLWVAGTNDFFFPMNSLQRSYRLPTGPRTLSVQLRMAHGQGQGAAPTEILAFADSILRGGPALPVVSVPKRDGNAVSCSVRAAGPVKKAELLYTRAGGPWKDRLWESTPAMFDPATNRVTATLPEGTTVYFLSIEDNAGHRVTSEHEEVALAGAAR